jgi:hypothetical protein
VIKIFIFINCLLKYLFPLIVGTVVVTCAFIEISSVFIIVVFLFILFFNNHEKIIENSDSCEIEFLTMNILSKQTIQQRIKIYFPLIFQNTVIFIFAWIIFACFHKSFLDAFFGIAISLGEPVIEWFIIARNNFLMRAFRKNDVSILKSRVPVVMRGNLENIFSLSFARMFYPIKKKFIRPFSIVFMILLVVFLFLKRKNLWNDDIFFFYYCSILPSYYHFFIKKIIDKTDFFYLSEISNYYYMKKFSLRSVFVKEFSRILFTNTLVIIFLLLLPIFFLQSLLFALLVSFFMLFLFYFIVELNMFQKTAIVRDSMAELKFGFYLNPLEFIEDFFVIGSAMYFSSAWLFYCTRSNKMFLLQVFPFIYFCFVIIYIFIKERVICAENQKNSEKI